MLVVVIVVSKIIIKPLFYYFYLLFYIIDVAIEILNENNLAVLDGCFNSIVDQLAYFHIPLQQLVR